MGGQASVVVTTHRRNDVLGDAIESALAQTYDPVEVVVVDDSGGRLVEPVVDDHDVGYVAHEENRGQVAAWETGLDATDGRYVQFLDDDDELDERKIEAQVRLLEGRSDIGVAYCGHERSDGRTVRPAPDAQGDVLDEALALHFQSTVTSTLLMDREVLESVRPIPAYPAGTDIPLRIELATRTGFDYVDEVLVSREYDPHSQGRSLPAVEARWRIIEEYDDLYATVPDAVKQRAVANAGYFEKDIRFRNSWWSARGLAALWRAVRADPDANLLPYAHFLVSVFGLPGSVLAKTAWEGWKSLRSRDDRDRNPESDGNWRRSKR